MNGTKSISIDGCGQTHYYKEVRNSGEYMLIMGHPPKFHTIFNEVFLHILSNLDRDDKLLTVSQILGSKNNDL